MAITVLGSDFSALGTWQLDYDSVSKTVGHTCVSTGGSKLVLTVIRVSDQAQFTKDVSADFGQGRIVDITGIQPNEVPAHVKGTPYPFLFAGTWTP